MKKFHHIFIYLLLFVSITAFSSNIQVNSYKIRRNGCLSFTYDNFPVISRIDMTFFETGDKPVAQLQLQQLNLKDLMAGKTVKLTDSLPNNQGNYTFSCSIKKGPNHKATINVSCYGKITNPKTSIKSSLEIYLGKALYLDLMKNRLNESWDNITTYSTLGKNTFSLSKTNSNWKLYNRQDARWLDEHERSIIVVGSTFCKAKESKNYKLSFSLDIEPFKFTPQLLELQYLTRLNNNLKKHPNSAKYKTSLDKIDKNFAILFTAPQKKYFDYSRFAELKNTLLAIASKPDFQTTGRYNIPTVVPKPVKMTFNKGNYSFDKHSTITIPNNSDKELLSIANMLAEELKNYRNLDVKVKKSNTTKIASQAIILKTVAKKNAKDGEYTLHITPKNIIITGSNNRGTFYGTQSLIQLLKKNHLNQITAACVSIHDYPSLPIRSVPLEMSRYPHAREFAERLIPRWIARYKHNYLMPLIADGNVLWKSHPELPKATKESSWGKYKDTLTMEELALYTQKAHKYFMDVIPQLQVAGHSDSIVASHPEMADEPGNKRNTTLNIGKTETRQLLCDLIDELVSTLKPKEFFNIGGDEMNSIGKNPDCKGRNPVELFTEHITFFRNYLKNKYNLKTIMWSDMLLDDKKWGWPGTKLGTHDAVDTLPKDILIIYWNYMGRESFPAYKHLTDKGFKVLGAPWFVDKCNYTMAESIKKYNGIGFAITNWVITTRRNSMLANLIVTDKSWNPQDTRSLKEIQSYDPDEHLQHSVMLPQVSEFANTSASPLDISKSFNASIKDTTPNPNLKNVNDLDSLPQGIKTLANVPYNLTKVKSPKGLIAVSKNGKFPSTVKVDLNKKVKGLAFLHSAIKERGKLGNYTIKYNDGTQVIVPIESGMNITPLKYDIKDNEWGFHGTRTRLQLIANAKRAWKGIAPTGETIALQSFEWLNPHPEKIIKSFSLTSTAKDDRIILLGVTAFYENKK